MIIKFTAETSKCELPVFGEVITNQFFINIDENLCQKSGSGSYNIIATSDNKPYSYSYDITGNTKIQKILPKVTKIEF